MFWFITTGNTEEPGLFGQGDFKGVIDWTSEKAQSRPLVDIKGSVLVGVEGRF